MTAQAKRLKKQDDTAREHQVFEGRAFSGGVPIKPVIEPPAEPRAFVPLAGQNLLLTPRGEGRLLTPFQTLRVLADQCDAVRIIIEDLKGQVRGHSWDFATKSTVDQSMTGALATARAFWNRPDSTNDFGSWLSMALEEILVTDAWAMYRWRQIDGEPLGLLLIDDTTIKPLVDFHGIAARPPEPAYQQIVSGMPETEFTAAWGDAELFDPEGNPKNELTYAPKNPRAWTPYGQSPTERFIMTINIIMRRQLHYLHYYTEGTIPDSFYKVPEAWTAQQVKEMQVIFEELMTNDSARRSKLRFMPGGAGTGLENPRGQDEWQFGFEEFLYRVASWAFGVSALPIVRMMNRATSEQAEQQATDAGAKPLMRFLAARFTRETEEFLGLSGIEFKWTEEENESAQLKHERKRDWLDRAVITTDEVREEEGRQPFGVPYVMTPSGPFVLRRQELEDFAGVPPATSVTRPATGQLPGNGAGATLDAAPDLRRWRKVAMRCVREGKVGVSSPMVKFETKVVEPALALALREWLTAASSTCDVAWAFRTLTKARRPLLAARRRMRVERRVKRVVRAHFKDRRKDLSALALESFRDQAKLTQGMKAIRIGKAGPNQADVDGVMAWDVLARDLEEPLKDAYLEAEVVIGDLPAGGDQAFALTDEAATAYAQDRGAELVGMRRQDDGTIIENPNARFTVSSTVREDLKTTIETALEEGWTERRLEREIEGAGFSAVRADRIARTETAMAFNAATADTYKEAGVKEVDVLDGPGCLEDGHNDAVSGVNGQRWSLAKSIQFPLGHPNCRRDFAPVIT